MLFCSFVPLAPAQTATSDLKSEVAKMFTEPHREGKTRYTLNDFIDGKLSAPAAEKLVADFGRYAASWQADFVAASKLAKGTPEDRTILDLMRIAHRRIEDAKGDKARIDTARRALADLRRRVN